MFDNQAFDHVPTRYKGDGTEDATNYYNNNCLNDIDFTDGQLLFSGAQMAKQASCNPFTGNAGNHYSWPAATAGGSKSSGNENNSICPRAWQLTVNAKTEVKSWYYLIRNTYNIKDSNDSKLLPLPMSFVRSGYYYQGSLNYRARDGVYWSSTASSSNYAYILNFNSGGLNPQNGNLSKNYGISVRCVSR